MTNDVAKAKEMKEGMEIVRGEDGKFSRKAIYETFSSVTPETREEKIKMLNLLDGDGGALPMNDHVGDKIELVDVITNPYDQVDEETGEIHYGVLTYLFSVNGDVYVTSSKSVYHTVKNIFKVFGYPHYDKEDALILQIVKQPGRQHKFVNVKLIG